MFQRLRDMGCHFNTLLLVVYCFCKLSRKSVSWDFCELYVNSTVLNRIWFAGGSEGKGWRLNHQKHLRCGADDGQEPSLKNRVWFLDPIGFALRNITPALCSNTFLIQHSALFDQRSSPWTELVRFGGDQKFYGRLGHFMFHENDAGFMPSITKHPCWSPVVDITTVHSVFKTFQCLTILSLSVSLLGSVW